MKKVIMMLSALAAVITLTACQDSAQVTETNDTEANVTEVNSTETNVTEANATETNASAE